MTYGIFADDDFGSKPLAVFNTRAAAEEHLAKLQVKNPGVAYRVWTRERPMGAKEFKQLQKFVNGEDQDTFVGQPSPPLSLTTKKELP